ncbi:hypothetical protein [Chryseolinea lacunae]|uniref:Uncharacterized protein n=1 Tax=Chryseolinea lacunae TaxID=2801331 RepID=A0ABS1KZV2_9BACT|nr:hypothetical protein [Chryseolinea lacunae]MBL0744803.1 hypothetical protein [Chryseolinea lacunae]
MKATRYWMIGFALVACTGKLDRAAYADFVQNYDNGLHVTQDTDGFRFDAQYQPIELLNLWQPDFGDNDSLHHVVLTIRPVDAQQDLVRYQTTDEEVMQKRLYYFSFLFQDDITLQSDGKKMPCVLFHYERPADARRPHTFVMGFEKKPEADKHVTLQIDSPLISSLPVKLEISLANLPELAL